MNALLLMVLIFLGYILAYFTYGKWLGSKIFQLNASNRVPSSEFEDGIDYVPTKKSILFGHHFTSIAGTGPIVGPAIGVIWGWVPAVIWVFFGSIFMGAVHDFSALVISMRNKGKSISEITGLYINDRVKKMFFVIVFLSLLIVLAIFGLVIAIIFSKFPQSVLSVWVQIPIAMTLGWRVFKKGGNLIIFTLISVILMYSTMIIGQYVSFVLPSLFGIPSTGLWTIILLIYAYFASTLPVTTLLQPRDYINAWQLYISLGLILAGIVVSAFTQGLPMAAPAFQAHPEGAPSMWPFLFITIACGSISGFHCLVCSGTTAKQIKNESDAQFIGYGAMLLEGALATVIIIAVCAGLGLGYSSGEETLFGVNAWNSHYLSWQSSGGLGSKLNAVVIGCSNLLSTLGIPSSFGTIIIGVFIASFAGTTLDSATRVQRYIISEMVSNTRFKKLGSKWTATGIAVSTAALLAFSSGANGKGALALWPLFGAVNQLLGALALMVATLYLKTKGGKKYLVTGIPFLFMIFMTIWSVSLNQLWFYNSKQTLLFVMNLIISGLSLWMVIESIVEFAKSPKT
ncbi:carbon starvation protein A [bacterium]|jgi:carbon starvation protein|nr:carbon starvation protein A [bacterium]